jgi:hypothetical protein
VVPLRVPLYANLRLSISNSTTGNANMWQGYSRGAVLVTFVVGLAEQYCMYCFCGLGTQHVVWVACRFGQQAVVSSKLIG